MRYAMCVTSIHYARSTHAYSEWKKESERAMTMIATMMVDTLWCNSQQKPTHSSTPNKKKMEIQKKKEKIVVFH